MLDIQFIRENPDLVAKNSAAKNIEVDINEFIKLDEARLKLLKDIEELRAERNELNAGSKGRKPSDEVIVKGKKLREKIDNLEEVLRKTDDRYKKILLSIPNIALDEVPLGKSEDENKVRATVGDKPQFDFTPKTHTQIGLAKGWIDKERAAKVAGSRFVYIKGDLAKLEFALLQYGIDRLTDKKFLESVIKKHKLKADNKPFTFVLPPAMARTAVYEATARLDKEETTYKLAEDDVWLNASAEHTLVPMHMDEKLDEGDLPLRYLGYTTAFRREAGSYGKDTEGIIRLHQFNKLEMESFSSADKGLDEHILLTMLQRELMEELEIPYQLIQKCTADIGGPNASGWDINCWMAGEGRYVETHTSDYMTD